MCAIKLVPIFQNEMKAQATCRPLYSHTKESIKPSDIISQTDNQTNTVCDESTNMQYIYQGHYQDDVFSAFAQNISSFRL